MDSRRRARKINRPARQSENYQPGTAPPLKMVSAALGLRVIDKIAEIPSRFLHSYYFPCHQNIHIRRILIFNKYAVCTGESPVC